MTPLPLILLLAVQAPQEGGAKSVPKDSVEIESFPKPSNPLESLFGNLDDNSPADAALFTALGMRLPKAVREAALWPRLAKEGVLLVQPFGIEIK